MANAAQQVCSGCGQTVEADAAFCARCGASLQGGVSVDGRIALDEIIVLLREYADASGALAVLPKAYERIEAARKVAETRGNDEGIQQADAALGQLAGKEQLAWERAEHVKARLNEFDRSQVLAVRDQLLRHASVDEGTKDGLRADQMNVFQSASSQPQRPVARNDRTNQTAPAPKIEYKRESRREMSKSKSSAAQNQGGSDDAGFKMFVVAAFLASLLGIAILWYVIASSGPDAFGGWSLVVGIVGTLVLLGIAFVCRGYWAAACPNCDRWGAATVVDSQLLDRHMRGEDVERTDTHYDKDFHLAGRTVRQEQILRTVETFHVVYRCRFCSHLWEGVETREH